MMTILFILYLTVFTMANDIGLHQDDGHGDEIDFDQFYDEVERLAVDALFLNYQLHFKPNVEGGVFECEETVKIQLVKESYFLELHGAEIEIVSSQLKGESGQVFEMTSTYYDEESLVYRFHFKKALKPGVYDFEFKLNGKISDGFDGFYRSKYTVEGVEKYVAITQMEPTGARKMFLCADDPMYKSTFDISVTISPGLVALSNGKESHRVIDSDTVIVTFDTTPKMSTYLVALVIGEFEVVESSSQNGKTLIRVFTTPGQVERAMFAASFAGKTLDFFSSYFYYDYPLPKLDLVAIPDFAAGAMENWGCMTFRETALLFDREKSSLKSKMRVAEVIAHEIAHQWFGNLVTMNWWSDLWLKEGFATWGAHLAINHVFPEWNIWNEFVSSYVFSAFELDSLDASHPIQVKVNKISEISEIYDQISYNKGASIIHMLANYIGPGMFRECLVKYLAKFEYSSTKTKDLWDVIEEVSGKDISSMLHYWTNTKGYPIVSLDPLGRTPYLLTQKPFVHLPAKEILPFEELIAKGQYKKLASELPVAGYEALRIGREFNLFNINHVMSDQINLEIQKMFTELSETAQIQLKNIIGDHGIEQDTMELPKNLWQIPISLGLYQKESSQPFWVENDLLLDTPMTKVDPKMSGWKLAIGNPNRTGYYRVKLNSDQIIKRLDANLYALPSITRLGIANDAFALFYSGNINAFEFLDTIRAFSGDFDRNVVQDITVNVNKFSTIYSNVNDANVTVLWNEWIRGLFEPQLEVIGWEIEQGEPADRDLMRALMLKTMCLTGYDTFVAEGKKRFNDLFDAESTDDRIDMRSTLYSVGIATGGEYEFNLLREQYLASDLAEEKARCLQAFGEARSRKVIRLVLDFALSEHVRAQDLHIVFGSLGTHTAGRELAWGFIQKNYDQITEKLQGNVWLLGRILKSIASNFASKEKLAEFKQLIEDKQQDKLDRTIQQIEERINLNYAFITRSSIPLTRAFEIQIAHWQEVMSASTIIENDSEIDEILRQDWEEGKARRGDPLDQEIGN